MSKQTGELVDLSSTKSEKRLDAAAVVANLVPWIGGAVGNVLSGVTQGRKLERVAQVLTRLNNDIENLSSDISMRYVKTEEFEELLEQTLRRAADEREPSVRALYSKFLRRSIFQGEEVYDEQIRVLDTLQKLRPTQVDVLNAFMSPPSKDAHRKLTGSPLQTLCQRTGLDRSEVEQAVEMLNDLKVTKMTSLKAMMTGLGSENLSGSITDLGGKVLRYIRDIEEESTPLSKRREWRS